MDRNRITVYDQLGHSKDYEILFTYEDEETKRNYVFYYDDGEHVFISRYDHKGALYEVEDGQEWELLEEVFDSFMSENEEDEETSYCDDGCD